MSRWNHLLRVINWETLSSTELLQPLESAIQTQFIPAITGQGSKSENYLHYQRSWSPEPHQKAKEQRTTSQRICVPLVDRIVHEEHHLGDCHIAKQSIKTRLCSHKCTQQKEAAKEYPKQTTIYSPMLNGALSTEGSIHLPHLIAN